MVTFIIVEHNGFQSRYHWEHLGSAIKALLSTYKSNPSQERKKEKPL